jgi:hypothetical protein
MGLHPDDLAAIENAAYLGTLRALQEGAGQPLATPATTDQEIEGIVSRMRAKADKAALAAKIGEPKGKTNNPSKGDIKAIATEVVRQMRQLEDVQMDQAHLVRTTTSKERNAMARERMRQIDAEKKRTGAIQ